MASIPISSNSNTAIRIVVTGTGTCGSRSAACGGSAPVLTPNKDIAHGKKIVAHLLETTEPDLIFERGKFAVAGTARSGCLADAAQVPTCLIGTPGNTDLDHLQAVPYRRDQPLRSGVCVYT